MDANTLLVLLQIVVPIIVLAVGWVVSQVIALKGSVATLNAQVQAQSDKMDSFEHWLARVEGKIDTVLERARR